MDYRTDQSNTAWENMTLEEKNHQLYLNEKELLDTFL